LDKVDVLTPPSDEAEKPDIETLKEVLTKGTSKAAPIITPEMVVLGTWRSLEGTMRQLIDKLHSRSEGLCGLPR
jgi:isocitrate dehydrogenase